MNQADEPVYLSLSAASRMLGVHSTTLRRWADAGAVPVYVTPGGHRRFARHDIEQLVASKGLPARVLADTWAARALAQTRAELTHTGPSQPGWLVALPEEERLARRRVGQRLMGIVLRYVGSHGHDEALLEEARQVGADYAQSAIRYGLPLTSALEAAFFFRDALIEAASDLSERGRTQPQATAELIRQINRVLNVVQLAIAAAYE